MYLGMGEPRSTCSISGGWDIGDLMASRIILQSGWWSWELPFGPRAFWCAAWTSAGGHAACLPLVGLPSILSPSICALLS